MAEEQRERNPNIATFTGYVHKVGERQESQSGYAWRDVVLVEDPSAQFQTYCVVTAKHSPKSQKFDMTKSDKIKAGNKVEVSYIPDGREWNGRWFGGLKMLFVNVLEDVDALANAAKDKVPAPAEPPHETAGYAEADDLPF